MRRNALESLKRWKSDDDRKPMVLKGARQAGETWLMKEFVRSCCRHAVYFNFDEEDGLKSIFEANKNPQRIMELLSLVAGERTLPGETRIIFDEIQECPAALNALKYFKEKAGEYHAIAAGSLHTPCAFPSGDTAGTEQLRTCRFIWPGRRRICYSSYEAGTRPGFPPSN